MGRSEVQTVKDALTAAGVEIYRSRDTEIHIAERIRLHIMDSGVRVMATQPSEVRFTARSQRSDFPNVAADELFAKVRERVGTLAAARGYHETSAVSTDVKDPVDHQKVLDVWHEVTYAKSLDDLAAVVEEVRWALTLEKYVSG